MEIDEDRLRAVILHSKHKEDTTETSGETTAGPWAPDILIHVQK